MGGQNNRSYRGEFVLFLFVNYFIFRQLGIMPTPETIFFILLFCFETVFYIKSIPTKKNGKLDFIRINITDLLTISLTLCASFEILCRLWMNRRLNFVARVFFVYVLTFFQLKIPKFHFFPWNSDILSFFNRTVAWVRFQFEKFILTFERCMLTIYCSKISELCSG